ncbi:WXG100 family type VII secretion target, partial [Streptomyces oryzae]
GGDGKWIQVTDDVLRGHAKNVREVLATSFDKVDDAAKRETDQVPGSMKGFASDEAFKEFQRMWDEQMKYLKGKYAGVAKALDSAAKNFKSTDVWTKEQVEKIERERREEQDKPSVPSLTTKDPLVGPTSRGYTGPPALTTPENPLYPGKPLYGPYVPSQTQTQTPTLTPTATPTFEPKS